jgi:hypothetical protein
MLENHLKKQGFGDVRSMIDNDRLTTSLVLVTAFIPAGSRKDELVDIQVTVPEESRTTSLKGGKLYACELVDFNTSENLKSVVHQGQPGGPGGNLLLGNTWVKAEGPLVAGEFTTSETKPGAAPAQQLGEAPSYRTARIWGGGRITRARPYAFVLKPGEQRWARAGNVAERLNTTFHGAGDLSGKLAEAKSASLVMVNVPYPYRLNSNRFLLVARSVPLSRVPEDSAYRRRLETELLQPETAMASAIKLEALGGDCRRTLRQGLVVPNPWVRFAAAESLAYMGHSDGAADLAKLAEDHPALRSHCLKALASSDDAAFTDRLVELMGNPDPALRYGAFVALRLGDPGNQAVQGQLLNHSLWIHQVAAGSPGMIHLTSDRRSEVVLFGDGIQLRGPVPPLPIGSDYTIQMPAGKDLVKITRIIKEKGEHKVEEKLCKPDLYDILVMIARLGGGHAEAVELIQRADAAQVLTARVAINAIPLEMPLVQLAGFAKNDPNLVKANVEIARVGSPQADPDSAGIDLPGNQEETKPAPATAPRPPLSREPGRIFGPRRQPDPVVDSLTPAAPVTPASDAAPVTDPQPATTPDLSRNPGTLFPRK